MKIKIVFIVFLLFPAFFCSSATVTGAYFRKVHQLDRGTIHIFFQNTSSRPVEVKKVFYNGIEIDTIPNDFCIWHQTVPPVIEPGEFANLKIKQRWDTNKLIRISALLSSGETIDTVIEPAPPDLKFSFIGFSKDYKQVYLYLENTGREPTKIKEVFCQDGEITKYCYIPEDTVMPSSKALIIYTPDNDLRHGSYLSFRVITEKGLAVQSISRVYSHFPIAAWGTDLRTELGFDPENFEMRYPKNKEAFQKYKDELHFKAYQLLEDPVCRDGKGGQLLGTSAREIIEQAKVCYEFDPNHPTLIHICEYQKPDCYFVYGEVTDIGVVNPYEIIFYRNPPEKNAYFTALGKLASEPRPLWTIPEAFTYRGTRFPTPEEERIIVWSEIGEGSKGIWYYVSSPKAGYPASPPLEVEIGRINRELQALKEYIVISEPVSLVQVDTEKVTAYTLLCGDKGILLIMVNNDHTSYFEEDKKPFTYQPKENFNAEVKIPQWLKVKGIMEIKADETIENVKYQTEREKLIIPIDRLDVTKQFLITTERK
jgi:hypothetical protein